MKRRPSPPHHDHRPSVESSRDDEEFKPQRQAPLSRRVALYLVGRDVIYKDKG